MKLFLKVSTAAVTAGLLFAVAGCSGGDGGDEGGGGGGDATFSLWATADYTGVGSGLGKTYLDILELAVDEINDDGGFEVDGRTVTFELHTIDNQSDPTLGAAEARKAIDEEGAVLLLGDTTTMAKAIQPILTPRQIPMLWLGADPGVLEAGAGYYFGITPGPNDRATLLAQYFEENDLDSAALITEDSGYGESYSAAFESIFPENDIEITKEEIFAPGTTDFYGPLTSLMSADPDAIIILSTAPASGGLITKQAVELNYDGLISSDGTATSGVAYTDAAGDALNNVVGLGYGTDPTYEQDNTKKVVAAFEDRYGYSPLPVGLYWYSYPYMVADTLSRAGTLDDTEKIRDALAQVSLPDTITGPISFVEDDGGVVPINQVQPVLSIVKWSTDGGVHLEKESTWLRDPSSGDWSKQ